MEDASWEDAIEGAEKGKTGGVARATGRVRSGRGVWKKSDSKGLVEIDGLSRLRDRSESFKAKGRKIDAKVDSMERSKQSREELFIVIYIAKDMALSRSLLP
eukprot:3457642-Karenia_brevis.AAC.1